LSHIKIENVSAKLRAFKTSQWAHRWTTTNLSVFTAAHPITLPYYDDRMLQFICTVPEAFLADRQLQIAHLQQNKALASVTWQAQKPFSINSYQYNKTPYNVPYRIVNKFQREFKDMLGRPYIQRNFELQFLGANNQYQLEQHLIAKEFLDWVPNPLATNVFENFYTKDAVKYSRPFSMLLTLSQWFHKQTNKQYF